MKPTRIAGRHYDRIAAIGEPEDRSVPYVLDKLLDYLLNGAELPQYVADCINVQHPETSGNMTFPEQVLLKPSPTQLPGSAELKQAVEAFNKPSHTEPEPAAPADTASDASAGDLDQIVLPDDDKKYAITVDVMGDQQPVKSDLSYDEAEAYVRQHDINGEMSINEQPRGYKAPKAAPSTNKRRKR